MRTKKLLSILTVLAILVTIIFTLTTCKKKEDTSETQNRFSFKENNLIIVESNFLPNDLLELQKTEFNLKRNSAGYEVYLDSLSKITEDLYKVLTDQNQLQEFKNQLNIVWNKVNALKSSKGLNLDCTLANLGFGYEEGVSISADATAALAIGILGEVSANHGGGIKVVYDFVNLERQFYYFSVCNMDPAFNWGLGLGVAIEAGLGFTGFVDLITGIKCNTVGIGQLTGPSIEKSYSLNIDLGAYFKFPLDQLTFAKWKKRNGDCNNANPLVECPQVFGNNFSSIKGYTIGIGGSASIGFAFMVALQSSDVGICSTPFTTNLSYTNFDRNTNKYSRNYAGRKMAMELLVGNSFQGMSLSGGLMNVGPAALAVLYGFSNPCNCQINNNSPLLPSSPSPTNNSTNVSPMPILEWICSDPENDNLTYAIYFGTTNNPPLLLENLEQSSSQFTTQLQIGTKYYWKIVAYDDQGNSTNGDVWSFTTNGGGTVPTVFTTIITNISTTSALSGGNVTSDGGSSVTDRGVCWSTFHLPTIGYSHTNDGSGMGSFTSNITDLSSNTPYYVRAYATNSAGTGYGDEVNFSTLPATFYIGQSYGGGTIFYIDGTGNHGLIVAPDNLHYAVWGCTGNAITGTSTAVGTGRSNTTAIVNGCNETGIAARLCDDLVLNGYDDWYLPSIDELDLLCKQATFIGGIPYANYWSSSEYNAGKAYHENFFYEYVMTDDKDLNYDVRPIRTF